MYMATGVFFLHIAADIIVLMITVYSLHCGRIAAVLMLMGTHCLITAFIMDMGTFCTGNGSTVAAADMLRMMFAQSQQGNILCISRSREIPQQHGTAKHQTQKFFQLFHKTASKYMVLMKYGNTITL